MNHFLIKDVTPDNAAEVGYFCIKDTKAPGFKSKLNWHKQRYKEGLRIKFLYADDKQIGFIEYVPSEFAWRPIEADNYLFIQCIFIYPNKYRSLGAASVLINEVLKDAKQLKRTGVCTMTSQGPWMATKKLFSKLGFEKVDKRGRFELMSLKLGNDKIKPKLLDWESKLSEYQGWHLLYADQCPWHEKAIKVLKDTAKVHGISLNIKRIETPDEAKQSPSGFGVFSLIKDGRLIEDHYISKRRFETILEKELN